MNGMDLFGIFSFVLTAVGIFVMACAANEVGLVKAWHAVTRYAQRHPMTQRLLPVVAKLTHAVNRYYP